MEINSQRVDYIDIAKGLGIILVVLGHCITMKTVSSRFIFSFHMPLFFFLSGLCFNENRYPSFTGFAWKRIRQLIFPCLIMSVIVSIGGEYLLNRDAIKAFEEGLPWALWFIPILFLSEIFYYLICKISIGKYTLYLRIAIILSLLYLGGLFQDMHLKIPYSLAALPSSIVFYSMGHYIKRHYGLATKNSKDKNIILSIVLFSLVLLFVLYTKLFTDMHYNIMRPLLLNYACAFLGIGGVISLSQVIDASKRTLLKSVMLFCGKNTLVIMGLHCFYLNVARVYVKPLMYDESSINSMSVYYVTEQIVLWSLVLISIFFINRKIPYLAGK